MKQMKRMKQLWLLLFLLAGNVLYAQTQKITTEEQFNAFINEQSAQLMAAYEQETYAKGSDICRAVMTQVETLPAGLKEKYGWQKYNFVFHLTLCLCLQNKKEEALEAFKIAYNNGKDGVLYSAVKGYEEILKPLHGDPAYEAIVRQLRETGDYLYILQQAPAYTRTTRPDTLPRFSYAAPDDPDLARVRQYFRLDSVISGAGDEISFS